ncbi:MAG: ROK family protein [Bacillota bacterium]
MTKSNTGNSKFLKAYNEEGILDLIRVKKALSRSDLSKLTGLSPTATGVIVSSLIDRGYIYETGTGESKGGRRPVLLELKPDSYYSVGIDIEVDNILFVLMDITGRVVHEGTAPMEANTPEAAVSAIAGIVSGIAETRSMDAGKLLGVGISVPGLVDVTSRMVILAPNLGWKEADIKGMLEKRLDIPVYIENEAMASAICEDWIGECRDVSDFVCVNIKSGIGAGIFTDGSLYRGSSGSAGEVGHIVVDEDGPKCGCGNRGCLETFASTGRIVEKARKLLKRGAVSTLNETGCAEDITFDDIVNAAMNGDAVSKGLLDEAAMYLGIALSGIVNMLNPSKIVLGKDFTKYGGMVMNIIRDEVDRRALKKPASNVEIIMSRMGERSSTLGAAIIPLKILFGG